MLLLFICSVVSNSLWSHELQHAKLPCPSVSPIICSNSCPLNQWCHPAISSFVIPFSSHPQSFPASGSFPMSWLFASGGQVLEFQPQRQSFQWIFSLFPWRWTGLIFLQSKGTLKSLLQHHSSNTSVLQCSAFCMVQLSNPYMTTWKKHSFDYSDLCQQNEVSPF